MKRLVKFLTASAVALAMGQGAAAQSTHGCNNLDGFHSLPSVEGREGVFFRVNPELRNFHPFSDETVEDMAKLSQALQQSGTQLIYVPVPPKAMVMTEFLPQRAYDYGFEPLLAATVYEDMIKRLREAGVTVANARQVLATGARGGMPYFQTDYRLNEYGLQLLAQSITQANGGGAGGGFGFQPQTQRPGATGVSFRDTQTSGQPETAAEGMEIRSDMRATLQRHCLMELPKVTLSGAPAPQTQDSQGGLGRGAGIVVVGSEYTGTPELNFSAVLGQAMRSDVQMVSVPNAGAYAALSAYVTSDAFQQSRPRVLIWENPIYRNLAQYGDQPIREVIAASGNACRQALPVQGGMEANSLRADLSSLDTTGNVTLFLDTGGSPASEARFTFHSRDGFSRTRTVSRPVEIARTGRFFVPASGLWSSGAQYVDIQLNAGLGASPRLTACYN